MPGMSGEAQRVPNDTIPNRNRFISLNIQLS